MPADKAASLPAAADISMTEPCATSTGRTELGSTGDQERRITVVAVVAMVKPARPIAMNDLMGDMTPISRIVAWKGFLGRIGNKSTSKDSEPRQWGIISDDRDFLAP